jgi:hypothetical protein
MDLVNKGNLIQEVNLNYDKVSLSDPKSVAARDDVIIQVRQLLG